LISYEKKNLTTTFIQLLKTEKFKNKIKINKYNEKQNTKEEEKIKILP
jgi:hypothetical protein